VRLRAPPGSGTPPDRFPCGAGPVGPLYRRGLPVPPPARSRPVLLLDPWLAARAVVDRPGLPRGGATVDGGGAGGLLLHGVAGLIYWQCPGRGSRASLASFPGRTLRPRQTRMAGQRVPCRSMSPTPAIPTCG